jgi:CHAT domain-containing protein
MAIAVNTSRRRSAFAASTIAAICLVAGSADCLWAADSTAANDPLAGIEDLILSGRTGEAKTAVAEAQRIFRQRRDRHGEALCVLVLAAAELVGADLPAATADFERSAALLTAVGDRFGTWMALWHLGLLEQAQKRSKEALAHQRQALALLGELDSSSAPFSLASLKVLGKYLQIRPDLDGPILLRIARAMSTTAAVPALLDLGRLEEAESELSQLRELSHQLGGMFGHEADIQLGDLRRRQWRLDEARDILRKALGEIRRYQPSGEKEILGLLIEIEAVSGRFDEALALSDRALNLVRQSHVVSDQIALLVLRSHVLRQLNRLAEAQQTLSEAMKLAAESSSASDQAMVQEQLGFLAEAEGHREQAAVHFESAARLFHALGRPDAEARIWIQLTIIYMRFESRAGADASLQRAREAASQSKSPWVQGLCEALAAVEQFVFGTGDVKKMKDGLLNLLTFPEVRESQNEKDRQSLLGILADLPQILAGAVAAPVSSAEKATADSPDLRGFARLTQGLMHFQQGEFAAARDSWLAALAESPRLDTEVYLLAFIGLSYAKERQDAQAISYLIRAVADVEKAAEDVQVEELLAGYLGSGSQAIFADLVDLLARTGKWDEAFAYAERARARAFLQGLGNPRLLSSQGVDPQLVREAEDLQSRILGLERRAVEASADEQERLATELRQDRESYQSLLVRLKVTNQNRAMRSKVEPAKSESVRAELPADTSMISYFVSSSQIHAWVLDRDSFQYVPLPITPQDLRSDLCWVDQIGRQNGGRGVQRLDVACGGGRDGAKDLYRKLIAPLRRHLLHRRLILVPHGELHYLPFAALRDPQSSRYLIEDFTLSYAPSASAVGFLRGKETPIGRKALVLGAPKELDTSLHRIPAAQAEAKLVGRLFGVRPLLGRAATESQLYKLAGKVDLLHIAAHGIFEPRNPLFSHVALAPDKDSDGRLEVHEILSDLDLSGVNLVVLSACETARGERSGGDEITGLTRAFLYAGSPGVISTLWNIDDEAAATLMAEFYRRLLDGAPVAEALQQAQLALLHNPRFQDPSYWAAFSLAGDPQGRWGRAAKTEMP